MMTAAATGPQPPGEVQQEATAGHPGSGASRYYSLSIPVSLVHDPSLKSPGWETGHPLIPAGIVQLIGLWVCRETRGLPCSGDDQEAI